MNSPLVSVICLSYNQAKFLQNALDSALDQSYRNFELIIVDDGSSDESEEIIKHYKRLHPEIEIFLLEENIGYCKAFNLGLKASSGKYIIDLAADDILLPERIQLQVEAFEKLNESYTMCFTDAIHINEEGNIIKNHYLRNKAGKLIEKIPSGSVYNDIVERYFICSPTMMMRASHLKEMGGYDESLCFEDFDYWVRAARNYNFYYLDKVLTAKRKVEGSLSKKDINDSGYIKYQRDTLSVCKKIYKLNKTKEENKALTKRVKYELRQNYLTKNYKTALGYAKILKKLKEFNTADYIITSLALKKINVSGIYKKLK